MVSNVTGQSAFANSGYAVATPLGAAGGASTSASASALVKDTVQLSPVAQTAYNQLPSWGKHDADIIYNTTSTAAEKLAAYDDAGARVETAWEGTTGDLITRAGHTAGFSFGEAIEGSHFAAIADAVGEQLAGARSGSPENYHAASLAAGGGPIASDVVVPVSSPEDTELARGVREIDLHAQSRAEAFLESGSSSFVPTLSGGNQYGQECQPSEGVPAVDPVASQVVAASTVVAPFYLKGAAAALSLLAAYQNGDASYASARADTPKLVNKT